MKIRRLTQNSVTVVLSGLLAACSDGILIHAPTSNADESSVHQHMATSRSVLAGAEPTSTTCGIEHRDNTLASTELTMHFPADCGVTSVVRVPAVTNLQSPPQTMFICESPQWITRRSRCYVGLNPDGSCQQANSTFWYEMIVLNGSSSENQRTVFASRKFPLKISSSALILPGYSYGLCLIDFATRTIMQDDFASGHTTAPSGDIVHLTIELPSSYHSSFPDGDIFELFFESKPAT